MADTIPGDTSTTATITVGETLIGTFESADDRDWYRIDLTAGESISINLRGDPNGFASGLDTRLRFRDSAGNLVAEDDDSGDVQGASLLNLTAPVSGTYFIDVATDTSAGDGFELSVQSYVPPPVFTFDQIADYLVNGYFADQGLNPRSWAVAPGDSITVNITGLNAAGQTLAREALGLWSDVTGIVFTEVAVDEQIIFSDEDQFGVSTGVTTTGDTIIDAGINVAAQFLATNGAGFDTLSFQTYINVIGTVLGLGNAGDYFGFPEYATDAHYRNDCLSTTIMSGFDQAQNTFFQVQGFTQQFVLTPMNADIVAMSQMYGLSTTTRTGDTVYGFGSTANRAIFNANQFPGAAYTIFDSEGVDRLNYSGYGANQRIDLNPEIFSDVGGNVGNVMIARGTIIENADGGSGKDTIIGNAADNILKGNAGNDSLSGSGGNDTLNGGAGIDTADYSGASSGVTVNLTLAGVQNTIGGGNERLISVENLVGSAFNDTLTGKAGASRLTGGNGKDTLRGGDGNDVLDGGAGRDSLDGGAGLDTADYGSAGSGVTVRIIAAAQDTVGAGTDTLTAIDNLAGSAFNDKLTGNGAVNVLTGDAGNDTLGGGAGADTMRGGDGNDAYFIDSVGDKVVEAAGEGTDSVNSKVSFTLGANVEKLALTGTSATAGTGNDLANTLTGNSASNIINGKGGPDVMKGGGGSDTYVVNDAGDQVVETSASGGSADTVNSLVSFTLGTQVERLTLTGAAAVDGTGNGLFNIINGNSGVNTLKGAAGNDVLNGSGGADQLFGGGGNDDLTGGAGKDGFRFNTTPNATSNSDDILDFTPADDTIYLDRSIFVGIAANGALASGAFVAGTAAADADDRILYDSATGNIRYDPDGVGGDAAVLFATVDPGTALTAADFAGYVG